MKFILKQLQKQEHLFQKGGKLSFLHPLWDAQETFLFTPPDVTTKGPHIRDSIDLKRLMIMVVVALVPCTIFGIYNAGYQSAKALGILGQLSTGEIMANGAWICIPIILCSYAVGGLWEGVFAVVRGHKISEGFLVTGLLFPLTLPPTIPLWQVALGVTFGVVIGKEIFGGTGMNILNPALTARVFLFFSFPIDISGADPWVVKEASALLFTGTSAAPTVVDGFTGATALLRAAASSDATGVTDIQQFLMAKGAFHDFSLKNLFIGRVPGSMGETSTLMCLIGAVILIITRVGSWQIILSVIVGGAATAAATNALAGDSVPFLQLSPLHHLAMGGFMFGAVFMATDPVSASATGKGKFIYGFLVGVLTILIRFFNPAYPEGMMLSILFMNIFAPLIDHYVVRGNVKRRLKRAEQAG